jgi:hypothetical protein
MAQSSHHHLPAEAWSPWGNQGRLARTGIAHSWELGGSSRLMSVPGSCGGASAPASSAGPTTASRSRRASSSNRGANGAALWTPEIKEIDEYIARADALLAGPDADFYRPFVDVIRAFHRALARPGIGE